MPTRLVVFAVRNLPGYSAECHECVRVAAVQDLTALAQAHEAVAGAALAVAGGAEATEYSPSLHQPVHNLVERALIGYIELLGVVRALLFGIAADARYGKRR